MDWRRNHGKSRIASELGVEVQCLSHFFCTISNWDYDERHRRLLGTFWEIGTDYADYIQPPILSTVKCFHFLCYSSFPNFKNVCVNLVGSGYPGNNTPFIQEQTWSLDMLKESTEKWPNKFWCTSRTKLWHTVGNIVHAYRNQSPVYGQSLPASTLYSRGGTKYYKMIMVTFRQPSKSQTYVRRGCIM